MPYQLNLLLLALCLFVVWPGTVTIYVLLAALGWSFVTSFYGLLNGN